MPRLIQWLMTEDKHGDSPIWIAASVATGFASLLWICGLPTF